MRKTKITDPRRLRLVARLQSAGSIEELAALAKQIPEVLTPEFEQVIAELVQQALAQGEPEMAVALADRADALGTLREADPAGDGLFELLMQVPLADRVVELADAGDWNSWLIILRAAPELSSEAFLDYLDRCRPRVPEGETYLLEVLAAFLSECGDVGPDAAVGRWRSSAEVGEGTELPTEFQLACLSHLIDRIGGQDDAVAAQALGNLGALYYNRRTGDRGQNLKRAESLLREAIEMAGRHGATKPRAQAQQALMNVVLARDQQRNAEEALDLSLAALRGWEKDEDPELWGLIMTSRANTLAELGRLEDAIECYAASLTVFTRLTNPRRWGISMFGLANAHLRRWRRDRNKSDIETALTLHTEAAELRTRDQDERRWAMTQESLGWCRLLRDRPTERREDVDLAVGHFNAALEYYVPGTGERPGIMHGLGRALLARHEETADPADLAASKAALQEALEGSAMIDRRDAQNALALVHLRLAPADPSARTAAVAHQTAVLELTSAEDEPQRWADEALLLARIRLERGGAHQGEDHESAIGVLTKALALAEEPVSRAQILEALGMAHTWRPFGHKAADARKGMEFYREALASFTKEQDPTLWTSVHYAMAGSILAHAATGGDDDAERLAEVLSLLEEAGAAIQPDDRWGITKITKIENLVGAAHLAYGSREDAIAPLARARAGYARLGLVEEFADVQLQLARAYGPADRRTVRAAMTAQRLRPMTEYPFDFGKAAELVGHALLRQGEPERAGHAYRDAVRARRWALSVATLPTDRDLVRRHFGGDIAEQACLCFARAAEHAGNDGPRLLALAVESLDEGRMSGFPELETALVDALARHDPSLHEEYQATAASLRTLMGMDRSTLTGNLFGPRASIPDVETWLRVRDAAITIRARYTAVLDRIRATTGFDMMVRPMSLQEISRLLDPGEALADVLCDGEGTDRQLLLLVLPDGTVRTHWSEPGSNAFHDVSLWLPNQGVGQQIGGHGFVKHLARALEAAFPLASERICVPLASMLRSFGISRVHLVSCGILGHFPLHACPSTTDGAVALGEEFDVSYIPSAAVLRSLRARSASPFRTHLLTVSDPMPHPSPLRFAAVQQARITDVARGSGIPVRTVAEYEATREAFETAMRDASHVDLACHGWLDQLQAFDSGIELADGPVTLRHLLDSRLLEGVSLVTLTSCQSAVAASGPFEDEPISLATGFLIAGARAVLGTLWLVDDLATALLTARFYRHHLLDGLPPARSLGLAQSWVRALTVADVAAELGDPAPSDPLHRQIRLFSHPLYWAPYVLTSG